MLQGAFFLKGNISVDLNTRPQQGVMNFHLISFNCSQQTPAPVINVAPNYNGSDCDTITTQGTSTSEGIAVTIISSFGVKCGGKVFRLGIVIGLCVGVLLFAAIILLVVVFVKRRNKNGIEAQIREMGRQMNQLGAMSLKV